MKGWILKKTGFLQIIFLLLIFPSILLSELETNFHIKGENLDISSLLHSFPVLSQEWQLKGSLNPDLYIKRNKEVWEIHGKLHCEKFSLSKGNFYISSPSFNLKDLRIEEKYKKWFLNSLILSPEIDYFGLKFREVEASIGWENGNLIVEPSKYVLGEGKVHIEGKINFSTSQYPFNFKGRIDGININKLYPSSKGRINIHLRLNGMAKDPSSIQGWGKIEVENANLGKVPIILDIFSLLFKGSPSYITLDSAEGDFRIKDGFAYTDNLEFKGKGVSLLAKGYVGWNRKLDFLIFFKVSQELLKFNPLTKLFGVVIDRVGNAFVRIRMTGTIDNRHYTIVPFGIGEDIQDLLKKFLKIEK